MKMSKNFSSFSPHSMPRKETLKKWMRLLRNFLELLNLIPQEFSRLHLNTFHSHFRKDIQKISWKRDETSSFPENTWTHFYRVIWDGDDVKCKGEHLKMRKCSHLYSGIIAHTITDNKISEKIVFFSVMKMNLVSGKLSFVTEKTLHRFVLMCFWLLEAIVRNLTQHITFDRYQCLLYVYLMSLPTRYFVV